MDTDEINQEEQAGEGGTRRPQWIDTSTRPTGHTVPVETGRGQAVNVNVGAPFAETIDSIANQANYGGYYRVFLNGQEMLEPDEAPATIQEGQRIAICAYDKVG